MEFLLLVASFVVVVLATFAAFARRYRRCPSDKILVVYGKIGGHGLSARCHHGGAAFIWPIIQDYQFLELTPIPIEIKLEGALSQQNIRVNTPSTFTVGISTEPGVMENAAERVDVAGLVGDVLDVHVDQAQADLLQLDLDAVRDVLDQLVAVGVDRLDGHRGDDHAHLSEDDVARQQFDCAQFQT